MDVKTKNLSSLLSALQTQLDDDIADLLAQLEELAQQFEEEEETGNSMMVFAITKDGFTPLTFGFAPGSSMLMMLMLMQDGGGGLFGIQELPHEDTPILLMDSAGGLVLDAEVSLYLAGENAFVPIILPAPGGISMIPRTKGMILGTVSALGYEDVSFFARMGNATTEAAELSISVPSGPTAGLVWISVSVDGEPAVDADVSVDGGHQGETDADGKFEVTLKKGPHTIRAKYKGLERSADVTAWEARNTQIELQKAQVSIGDAVKGKLVDAYGNPVPGASVTLGGRSVPTGADGGFELSTEGVEPGTHSVIFGHMSDSVAHVSYATSSANIEITPGGTPWWQYAVAAIIFLIILRVGLFARRRIKKLPVRPERPPGATEA